MGLSLVQKSNLSDALIQKHIRFISEARDKLDEASGDYRATLKRAKAEGCNQKQLIAAMQARKSDPDKVMMELRDFVRYAALCNIPMQQMELFGNGSSGGGQAAVDGSPDGSERDGGAVEEHQLWEAKEAGRNAARNGRARSDNPHQPGTELFVTWDDGLLDEQDALAKKHGGKARVASTRRKRGPSDELTLHS